MGGDRPGQAGGVFEFTSAGTIGTDKLCVAEVADRRLPVLFETRPEVAAGKTAEDRRSSGLWACRPWFKPLIYGTGWRPLWGLVRCCRGSQNKPGSSGKPACKIGWIPASAMSGWTLKPIGGFPIFRFSGSTGVMNFPVPGKVTR